MPLLRSLTSANIPTIVRLSSPFGMKLWACIFSVIVLLGYISELISFSQYPVVISMCRLKSSFMFGIIFLIWFSFKNASCTCYNLVFHFNYFLSGLFFFLHLTFKKLLPCFSLILIKFSFWSILPPGLGYLVFISDMILFFSSFFPLSSVNSHCTSFCFLVHFFIFEYLIQGIFSTLPRHCFFFWMCCAACGILVPPAGGWSWPPAVEAGMLTTGAFLKIFPQLGVLIPAFLLHNVD